MTARYLIARVKMLEISAAVPTLQLSLGTAP
jgi:hypothetical protein